MRIKKAAGKVYGAAMTVAEKKGCVGSMTDSTKP